MIVEIPDEKPQRTSGEVLLLPHRNAAAADLCAQLRLDFGCSRMHQRHQRPVGERMIRLRFKGAQPYRAALCRPADRRAGQISVSRKGERQYVAAEGFDFFFGKPHYFASPLRIVRICASASSISRDTDGSPTPTMILRQRFMGRRTRCAALCPTATAIAGVISP